jgi:hypothetical protein
VTPVGPANDASSVGACNGVMSGSTFFNAAVGLVGHARGVREVNIAGKLTVSRA